MCSCRLADAGARVIKIERPEGDFARYYDQLAGGESAYFVWLNRGKESALTEKLEAAEMAFARVNDASKLAQHPHLRRMTVDTPSGSVSYPAAAILHPGEEHRWRRVPSLGEDTERIRAEFMPAAAATAGS